MNEKEIVLLLESVGAIITNSHIVYTSGKHGSSYINKDAVYPHTSITSLLCREIAQRFAHESVHAVIAPAVGGVILSQWVAHYMSEIKGYEVLALYADKTKNGNSFEIIRGYNTFIPNHNVLVVEDVITTGGSVKKVIEAVQKLGGTVVGGGVLGNRGGITKQDLGVPLLEALVNLQLETWAPEECPLCQQNVPVNTNVGKGREFLLRKQEAV